MVLPADSTNKIVAASTIHLITSLMKFQQTLATLLPNGSSKKVNIFSTILVTSIASVLFAYKSMGHHLSSLIYTVITVFIRLVLRNGLKIMFNVLCARGISESMITIRIIPSTKKLITSRFIIGMNTLIPILQMNKLTPCMMKIIVTLLKKKYNMNHM